MSKKKSRSGGVVYAIESARYSRPVYVARTTEYKRCQKWHLTNLQRGTHKNAELQGIYNSNPDFTFRILEVAGPNESIRYLEYQWQRRANPLVKKASPMSREILEDLELDAIEADRGIPDDEFDEDEPEDEGEIGDSDGPS